MTASWWKRAQAALLAIALISGWLGLKWFDQRHDEKARQQFQSAVNRAVMAQLSDLPTARVVSVSGDNGRACGWVYLAPEIGAVPFHALDSVDDPGDIFVSIPRLDATDPQEWVLAAYAKQLNLVVCDRRSRPPPPAAPVNAHQDHRVDRPIRALWDSSRPEWAIVPAPSGGYIALRRKVGGGATLSPVFTEHHKAHDWTLAEGAELARHQDAEGRQRLDALDACLARHAVGSPERKLC